MHELILLQKTSSFKQTAHAYTIYQESIFYYGLLILATKAKHICKWTVQYHLQVTKLFTVGLISYPYSKYMNCSIIFYCDFHQRSSSIMHLCISK